MENGLPNLYDTSASPAILAALGVFISLFAIALGLVWRRQRQAEREVIQTQWTTVREIAQEKELSPDEWRLLERLIRTHSPDDPLHAATVRRVFDACVDAEMAALGSAVNTPAGEKQGQMLRDLRVRLGLDYIPIGQRIGHTRDLIPGQTVWVAESESSSGHWIRTTVSAVDEANFFVTPAAPQDAAAFKPGQRLRFRLYREEDARYVLSAHLLQVESNPPLWKFEHTREMQRLQARAQYRIRHDQVTEVSIIAPPKPGGDGFEEPVVTGRVRGRISSLSGGGYAVILPQDVPVACLVRFQLVLEEEEPFAVTGRVIDSSPLTGGRYLLRGAFVGLGSERRDQITRYIFRLQQHHHPGELAEHLMSAE